MPREVRYRNDDSDEELEVARNVAEDVQETNSDKANMSNNDQGSEENDDDEEDDGESYEVERIVHHKRGQLVPNKMAFFVKWKGYPETENSWVLEEDCNAPVLISDYWKQKPEAKGKAVKRSRDVDVKMEDDDERPAKKTKKETVEKLNNKSKSRASVASSSAGRTKFRAVNDAADGDEDESSDIMHPQDEYGTMEDYWGEKDWTHIINKVLTVDYAHDDPNVLVYFCQLKNGTLAATTRDYMVERAPGLAIDFFEHNLKFHHS